MSGQPGPPGEAQPPQAAGTRPASHDDDLPDALKELMARGWEPPSGALPPREDVAPYARKRRALLAARFPGEALVVPTGGARVRANDTDHPFRPGSDFFWLTGCHEPDAVLVLSPSAAGDHEALLYLADRSDRSTPGFYRDRRHGELWAGPRRGVRETTAALEIECRPLSELPAALARLAPATTRVLRGLDRRVDERVLPFDPPPPAPGGPAAAGSTGPPRTRDEELATALSELRLVKDDYEVAMLEEAVAATVRGFEECVRAMPRAAREARGERWIEGTFWRRARLDGNDVGYGSIVACGAHATTLH
ncbi:MAG TPA: aminopeptidase P N-terminal domain-containing protein, partial [Frankiaceae bacterium]|nr:aminopeptidase P N-terminal domain-containing protein [Frankiaceae bacterium]